MKSITFFWEHLVSSERVGSSSICSYQISVDGDANQKRTLFSIASRTNLFRDASCLQSEQSFQIFNWNNFHMVCGKQKWIARRRSMKASSMAALEMHSSTMS